MRFLKLNAKLFAALCVLVYSCTNDKNLVRFTEKNFSDEIELQQNLVFKFDNDLCPDSLINRWDSVPYVKIVPAVKGSFMFTSKRELQFSPALRFEPCTNYRAEITSEVLRHADKK